MGNYIGAEFYKLFRRRLYLIGTLVALLAGVGLLVWMSWIQSVSGGNVSFPWAGQLSAYFLPMGLYLSIVVGDMVFSEQYKNNTMKNEVSFGLQRRRIYFGKLLVEVVVGVAVALLVMAAYLLLSWVLLPHGDSAANAQALAYAAYCTAVALPQWLATLAVFHMASSLMRNNTMASFATLGFVLVPYNVLRLLGYFINPVFTLIASVMPNAMIDNAGAFAGSGSYLALSWGMGALWSAIATIVGVSFFQKKEIS